MPFISQSSPTLRDHMGCSTPGFPVLHCLLEFVHIRSPPCTVQSSPFQPWSSYPAGALGYFPASGTTFRSLDTTPKHFPRAACAHRTGGDAGARFRRRRGRRGAHGREGLQTGEQGTALGLETRSSFRLRAPGGPARRPMPTGVVSRKEALLSPAGAHLDDSREEMPPPKAQPGSAADVP